MKDGFLYLRNFEPTRWPACNPETGYLNCDASPTKTFILEAHRQDPSDRSWALAFGRRPAESSTTSPATPTASITSPPSRAA